MCGQAAPGRVSPQEWQQLYSNISFISRRHQQDNFDGEHSYFTAVVRDPWHVPRSGGADSVTGQYEGEVSPTHSTGGTELLDDLAIRVQKLLQRRGNLRKEVYLQQPP